MYITEDDLTQMILAQMIEDRDGLSQTAPEKEAPRYPLTDIVSDKSENLFVELALAGFKKEMLEVEIVDGFGLVIRGIWASEDLETDFTYHQKNISQRDFVRKIALAEEYQTDTIDVQFNDGLLTIMIPKVKVEVQEPQRKIVPIG